jgi:predicted aldo/keto reductase-like oxidoreductase
MKDTGVGGNDKVSRRNFLRNTGVVAAGAIGGSLINKTEAQDTSKILNYNPKMGYRKLGKTGLIFSEVSFGGHWKDRRGDRYWSEFKNDEVPWDCVKNRIEVVSAGIDAGINYLDLSTKAECSAYGIVLKGRRDKMYIAVDDYQLCARKPERCTIEKLTFDLDECLRRIDMDSVDIWRVKADMEGRTTDAHMGVIIETFEKAKKAGKVKFLGISSHRRPWIEHVIKSFPEVDIVSFPVSAKTREKSKAPTKDNVEEVNAGYGADTEQSVFDAVRKYDKGLIAIKPFLGGNLFSLKTKFPVPEPGDKSEHDLARLTLQCILTNDAITATVPGLSSVQEVENAVRASYLRQIKPSAAEMQWLEEATDKSWAALPNDYAWLRDWEIV